MKRAVARPASLIERAIKNCVQLHFTGPVHNAGTGQQTFVSVCRLSLIAVTKMEERKKS